MSDLSEQRRAEIARVVVGLSALAPSDGLISSPLFHSPSYTTVFSNIGTGTDGDCDGVDATVAAVKAVRAASDNLHLVPAGSHPFRLHIRVGVPTCRPNRQQIMRVNPLSLREVLPLNISLLPIDVEVGGLRIPQQNSTGTTCIVVVACVSIKQLVATNPPQITTVAQAPAPSPSAMVEEGKTQRQVKRKIRSLPPQEKPTKPEDADPGRNPMDMLASVSTGMIDCSKDKKAKHRYKKLPPGTTSNNRTRVFVQHSYKDHSHEKPSNQDDAACPKADIFPVKLHHALTQIEKDGLDYIIGWLPHGRSFKVHKQQEFIDIILPKYFANAKNKTFNRQLGLYGFKKMFGIGEKGSYYHEKFLRGMFM